MKISTPITINEIKDNMFYIHDNTTNLYYHESESFDYVWKVLPKNNEFRYSAVRGDVAKRMHKF